ncbi:hypothetical protein [Bradyrhizobium sp. Ash2021]|uniref:hypothetical protein n=1 Tax=Bradyrhizobium sp. Ash2021 TaxID=2954771 RepID=UPI0028149D27|nr:hypothetical protein [Bradyrhizobium sp. Ash2021]WMT78225.1 hypothetical protein NL528_18600 [Bradyrhizobium sp. Ash2021]
MGLDPQPLGNVGRLDARRRPPVDFLTRAVQFAMIGEFVTDLLSETAGLRKAQVMRVAGLLSFGLQLTHNLAVTRAMSGSKLVAYELLQPRMAERLADVGSLFGLRPAERGSKEARPG